MIILFSIIGFLLLKVVSTKVCAIFYISLTFETVFDKLKAAYSHVSAILFESQFQMTETVYNNAKIQIISFLTCFI